MIRSVLVGGVLHARINSSQGEASEFFQIVKCFFDFFAKIIQTALSAVWIIAYLNEITDKPEVLILSLAAVMQSSYLDYYHLTAGKKRLWATQMGSAFWISSVVGGHHNLMLRRQQPGEHPIIDPAQEVSFPPNRGDGPLHPPR